MKESGKLAEADLALVEALQISPRAPWSAVARVLGTSPVTAARRWSRLRENGVAWVTGTPGVSVWNGHCLAYIGLRCSPGRSLAVAQTLAGDGHALSVELTTGTFDLFLTVAAADLRTLTRYVLERVDRIPGVTDSRVRVCTHLYRDGSRWRLGSLPQDAAARLPPAPCPATEPAAAGASWRAADNALLVRLGLDGRSTYAELAAATRMSEASARRRLGSLIAGGHVALRAEVAAHLAGWRVPVILEVDAPPARLAETAAAIARLRNVRLCATVAGTPAILVAAWMRNVESFHDFETALGRTIPQITVGERLVALRTVKRMGRLLDEEGRSTGAVPMDIWADPAGAAT